MLPGMHVTGTMGRLAAGCIAVCIVRAFWYKSLTAGFPLRPAPASLCHLALRCRMVAPYAHGLWAHPTSCSTTPSR